MELCCVLTLPWASRLRVYQVALSADTFPEHTCGMYHCPIEAVASRLSAGVLISYFRGCRGATEKSALLMQSQLNEQGYSTLPSSHVELLSLLFVLLATLRVATSAGVGAAFCSEQSGLLASCSYSIFTMRDNREVQFLVPHFLECAYLFGFHT